MSCRQVHQLTNNSKLVGYCLPRSSKDISNNPNYTTDDIPLTIKDKYKGEKNLIKVNNRFCILHLITESDSTDMPEYTLNMKLEQLIYQCRRQIGYLNYTSDQSIGPGLPTQMHIGAYRTLKNLQHYIQPISGFIYRTDQRGSQGNFNVISSNVGEEIHIIRSIHC